MIRISTDEDFDTILEIINDGASAYKGVIPADRWHEPYMSTDALRGEMKDQVVFYVLEIDGQPTGVMGIQDRGPVTLIRHAYVYTNQRRLGIGGRLLRFLRELTDKPILIGTWAAASWAISFYEKHGFRLVTTEEKNRLLKLYWNIPERQVETSVVLKSEK